MGFTQWGLMLAMTSPSHTKLWLHQTNNYSLMPCLAASQLASYQNQLIQQKGSNSCQSLVFFIINMYWSYPPPSFSKKIYTYKCWKIERIADFYFYLNKYNLSTVYNTQSRHELSLNSLNDISGMQLNVLVHVFSPFVLKKKPTKMIRSVIDYLWGIPLFIKFITEEYLEIKTKMRGETKCTGHFLNCKNIFYGLYITEKIY